jgi:hypothetical protein
MKGLGHVVFLTRAAGSLGHASAEALVRMCRENFDEMAAKALQKAIERPFTDKERAALFRASGLEPSQKSTKR